MRSGCETVEVLYEGLTRLNKALNAIKDEITAAKGIFNIHKEARVVSDIEEMIRKDAQFRPDTQSSIGLRTQQVTE